ncbi:hypothetical protein HRbin37_00704 [bacterium HR37]|nr:hypothetical protein HRbin37_00704 [bacterium HR37]
MQDIFENQRKYKKYDFINGVILGEIIAFFALAVLKNLEREIPGLHILVKFSWFIFLITPVLLTLWIYLFYVLGRKKPSLFQFGKFISIGVSNTAIDFGVLNLLMFVTNVQKGLLYSVFKSFSFLVAIVNSYLWNKFWAFESFETERMGRQFFHFAVISAVGFVINVALASLVVNFVHPVGGLSQKLWANVGAFVAVSVSVFWNFTGYKFLVFKR